MTARFRSPEESHAHSLRTLEILSGFDDFMENTRSMIDLGCGTGLDLEWWATRTTRDDSATPLNIRCMGVDRPATLGMAYRHNNITYRSQDFETEFTAQKKPFDVIWCHDSFQFVLDPFSTLRQWKKLLASNGTMFLIVPQSTNLEFNRQAYDQIDGVYWNWTVVGLMHVLAVCGWNCAEAFFRKDPDDPWIHAALRNTGDPPRDPRTTTWYDLVEHGMLPDSAVKCIKRHGFLRQRDLALTWIDGSTQSLALL
jgi:SAM-dependent methyltransferase